MKLTVEKFGIRRRRWIEEIEEKHQSTTDGTPQRDFSEQIAQPLFQTYRQQLSDMNKPSEASKVTLSQQQHAHRGTKTSPFTMNRPLDQTSAS